MSGDELRVVGRNILRKEGTGKVTGTTLYADDMKFDSCLYGGTVRSPVPRGRVKNIRFRDGMPWSEFVIVTPADIPGRNNVTLIEDSQPFLAVDVRHIAEAVAVIAHRDRQMVQKALGFIDVEIEEAPAIFSIEDGLSGREIQYGTNNIFKEYHLEHGDPVGGWKDAEFVLEETYTTAAQEQLYIEPQAIIAQAIPTGDITIWGSMQCPFYIQKALAPLFAVEPDRVRVVQTETGGGFGGKEEYPNLLAGHAALLSKKSGGTVVKMVYDRREDLWATTKRHPSRTRVKAGFKRDGRLVALEIDFVLNGGAYPTVSQTVLSRGVLHSWGPYRIPHAKVDGRVVMTNSNPYGAFRGFGAPQSIFAMELHMTRAAHALGIDPAEIRRRNLIRKGDCLPTGQVIKEEIDLERLLDRALEMADYARKRKEYDAANRRGGSIRRGIALSTFYHGSGFTGSGEVMLGSKVSARLSDKGGIEVLAANVEYGQGTNTTFTQIAAEVSRLPLDWIEIHQPDTSVVPNSGPTVASRTTMIVGRLVERAVRELVAAVIAEGNLPPDYSVEAFRRAARSCLQKHREFKRTVTYEPPANVYWDDKLYRGEAYAAYAWSCNIADVAVDLTTGLAEAKEYVAVVECGQVINPILAKGQIEGGIAQSIGLGLMEDCVMERGEMKNCQYTNYIIPTSADIPRIDVEFIQFPPSNNGPFQAKGIGELPANGAPPAIAGAIAQALDGEFINDVPILPEKILDRLERGRAAA